MYMFVFFFFFKQKTAYDMRISDWSSDVCSSDLVGLVVKGVAHKVLPVDTLTGKAGSDSERAVLACEQLRRRTIDAVGQPLDLAPGKTGFGDQRIDIG